VSGLRTLQLFARDPVPGRVKTRLIGALGQTAATALYRQMLLRTLATAARLRGVQRELWLDEPTPTHDLRAIATRYGMTLHTQRGPDLGTRMAAALARATAEGGMAVLIGSDCPGFDVAYLEAAYEALAGHDAVIGPAVDGGYVLIGVKHPQPELFRDVAWGTDRVLHTTRQRLHQIGLRWRELPVQRDLDQPGDLAHFPELAALADAMRRPTD
jgi:hypothetical protein